MDFNADHAGECLIKRIGLCPVRCNQSRTRSRSTRDHPDSHGARTYRLITAASVGQVWESALNRQSSALSGEAAPPRVKSQTVNEYPEGFYNAPVVKPRWGLKNGWSVNPGCAARPRASLSNASGVVRLHQPKLLALGMMPCGLCSFERLFSVSPASP